MQTIVVIVIYLIYRAGLYPLLDICSIVDYNSMLPSRYDPKSYTLGNEHLTVF
ncbi:hypothetical protein Hanom_Chr10g00928951 [Helianthus anomalus]